jgi:hypothetical protein
MKSCAPTAVALTLFMFLLVLAAAFFFLFQGQQSLKGDLQIEKDRFRTLGTQLGETELNNSAAQATVDALEQSGTSTAADNVLLTEQLVNSDQLKVTREANEALLMSELDNAKATVNSFESQAPSVTVVEPLANVNVTVGQSLDFVVVANDFAGVESVFFNINGDPQGGSVEDPGETVIITHTWPVKAEGPLTIIITANNVNGLTSQPHQIDFNVLAAPPTIPAVEPIP